MSADLKNKWERILEKEGLRAENSYQTKKNVIIPLRRPTQSPEEQDSIREFFLHLDWLLTHYECMPKFERKVMAMYSQGMFVTQIQKKVGSANKRYVRTVVSRYEHLIIAIIKMMAVVNIRPPMKPTSNQASEDTASAEVRVQNKAA